jgi:diacylglycerol kinase (CTP)
MDILHRASSPLPPALAFGRNMRYVIRSPGNVMTNGFSTSLIMLHTQHELHPLRKLWHVAAGLGLYWLIFHSGLSQAGAALLLAMLLTAVLGLELARLNLPSFNRRVIAVCRPIMRSREVRELSGTTFYLAGALTAILLFPDPVARLALLFLILADPAAAAAGVLSGHRGPRVTRDKTLVGTAAFTAVCMAVTLLFFVLWGRPVAPAALLLLTLGGGIAGAAADLSPLPVDDNLTIPLISGLLLWPLVAILL